ncbi:MAG: 2-phosphosulfolactate phosphatase [Ignavibacteria bacterium]
MKLYKNISDKTININLYFTHNHVESELDLKDKNVVVTDVLRTSTTMTAGLFNGAKEIVPTEDVATAGLIGRNSMGKSLLCGERNGKIIEGFNLGNSVVEYSTKVVRNKTLIFNSTNGTPAIMKSKFARNCVILSFVNLSCVADYLKTLGEDFILLCAGKNGEFSLEDAVCAGMLICNLIDNDSNQKYQFTDSALGASKLYSVYKDNILKMLRETEHGKFLCSIGFEDDLKDCSRVDVCPCLPVLRNGVIKLIESFESDPKLSMKKVSQKV